MIKLDDRVIYQGPIPHLADKVGTVVKIHPRHRNQDEHFYEVKFDAVDNDCHGVVPEHHLRAAVEE